MGELQTINETINSAVKNSSYITVIISCSVFILYTVINKVVELYKSKGRTKPLIEMASAIKQVSENVVKLNQVLNKTFEKAEQKETNRLIQVIITTFNSFKASIINRCIDIIVYNNIDADKDLVKQNIYKSVSTEYYKVYSIFSAYEHNNVIVASKIREEWIDDITEQCLQIIYNGQESVDRIRQINNKLTIDAEEYAIYINNKIFNN